MQGGVGAFSERLAHALAALGHELHVITHRQARPKAEGQSRPSLRELRRPVETEWGLLHAVARKWRWRDVGEIAQIAMRYELDLLNIQYQAAAYNMRNPAINLAPWRLGGIAPVVVTFHDVRVPYLFPKAGPLREYVVRLAARHSRGVIATNEEDRRRLESWTGAQTPVVEIPIGSNIDRHQAGVDEIAAARRQFGLPDNAFLVGYFGFLNATKGADLLVAALAQLRPEVHVAFIGGQTGSSDEKNNQLVVETVTAQARELGVADRIHWTGFLPDRALSLALQGCDLLAMPYRDGASLRRGTLMAGLAHGLPILTTEPLTPTAALAHGRNVWLVQRDNAQALAEAMHTLQKDAPLRQRLAEGAFELAGDFSWPSIARQSASFFATIRGNRGNGGDSVGSSLVTDE